MKKLYRRTSRSATLGKDLGTLAFLILTCYCIRVLFYHPDPILLFFSICFIIFIFYLSRHQIILLKDGDLYYRSWFSWKKMYPNELKIYFEIGPVLVIYFAMVKISKGSLLTSVRFWQASTFSDVRLYRDVKEMAKKSQSQVSPPDQNSSSG